MCFDEASPQRLNEGLIKELHTVFQIVCYENMVEARFEFVGVAKTTDNIFEIVRQ